MELTNIEKELLGVIQKHHPISWDETKRVWEITKSYDKTIKVIKMALRLGNSFTDQAYNFRK